MTPLRQNEPAGPSPRSQTTAATLALFTSFGTLVCCALPALFVSLGAGAALAGLIGAVPQLILLSEYKGVVFAVAAVMLTAAAVLRYAGRNAPCPADPALAASCRRIRRVSGVVLYIAIGVYAVGFFFAFLAVRVLA